MLEPQTKQPDTPGARLMSALAGVLESMDDLETYLNTLVFSVMDNIDGCDAVGVSVVMEDRPRTAAYTTARTLEIDAVQYAVGDGPCLDAFRHQRENLVDLGSAHERWPMFTKAIEGDVQTLLAVPLVTGDYCLGALNLYGQQRHAFDHTDLELVRMAASRAADAIGAVVETEGARQVAAQMEQAMASRAVIEQAKGILMGRHGIDEKDAFDLLRRRSQNLNIKLRMLARELVSEVRGDARGAQSAAAEDEMPA